MAATINLSSYVEKGSEIQPPALDKILTLKARNTTLLTLGGPDGNTIDPHGEWWAAHPTVLAKAVRGAWRWWLRTLLAPRYSAGNYQQLWRTEEELGLGSTRSASCYIIDVNVEISNQPIHIKKICDMLIQLIDKNTLQIEKNFLLNKINRKRRVVLRINDVLKDSYDDYNEKLIAYMLSKLRYYVLLSTPYRSAVFTRHNFEELQSLTPEALIKRLTYRRERIYDFLYWKQPLSPEQLTMTVTLYKRRNCRKEIDDLAKKALIYALTIGGIGAATTRGFGKFAITDNREAQQIQEEILRSYQSYRGRGVPSITKLTPIPDIDKAVKIKVQPFETVDILDVLVKISDAVRKYEWKKFSIMLGLTQRLPNKEHGDKYHTWILGLPRSVKYTGYFINPQEPGRWKSPFIFTPVTEGDGWNVLVTFFPLSDADLLLTDKKYKFHWRGKYSKEVRELSLLSPKGEQREWNTKDAYTAALEWIVKILN